MLMNSVLHNFSLLSASVGRLAAVMASVYDLSWKMNRIALLWMYSICFVCVGTGKILTRFNKICHPSQRPRWQVDKEAIGLSRCQLFDEKFGSPSDTRFVIKM